MGGCNILCGCGFDDIFICEGGGGVGWIYSIAFCSLFVLSVLRVYPSATGPGHLLPPESLFPLVVAR